MKGTGSALEKGQNYIGTLLKAAKANSPYIITSTLQIWGEATLTIAPGVIVKINPDTDIIAEGGIVALGLYSMPIVFGDKVDLRSNDLSPHLIRGNDNVPLAPDNAYRAQEYILSQWKI